MAASEAGHARKCHGDPASAKCARTYRPWLPVTSLPLERKRVRSMWRGGTWLGGAGTSRRSCRGRAGRRWLWRGRDQLVADWNLILLIGFNRAQPCHVFLMLLVCLGEGMAAGAVRDEKQFPCAGRICRRLERRAARIGDRSWRQAVDNVGIVWRRVFDFAFHYRAPKRAFAPDKPVDDCWVRLQLHLLFQPIDENGGDPRALLRFAGLFLDQRCQNHELLRGSERQVRSTMVPNLVQQALLRLLHALNHLLAADAAREIIGVGQQTALARNFLDVASQDVV